MDLPIRFPSEPEKIHQQALAYRRLNPSERFLAILDLIASGALFLEHSPHGKAGEEVRRAHECEWRRIHKEVFHSHAP